MRCRATRRRPAKPAATAMSPNPSARASSSPKSANSCREHGAASFSGAMRMREPALILVVDDVPDNVEILQLRLESQGYEVIAAGDGEMALAVARTAAGPDPARHPDAEDG